MQEEPRATQRPPRSCLRCTKSKIKCDKSLPCMQCRSRGLASQCRSETVRHHGRTCQYVDLTFRLALTSSKRIPVPSPKNNSNQSIRGGSSSSRPEPSYAELVEENRKLKAALSNHQSHSFTTSNVGHVQLVGPNEEVLYKDLRNQSRRERFRHMSQVWFPSETCTNILLSHGARWTFWLHGALDQQQFERQVYDFHKRNPLESLVCASPPPDNPWLGIFFAYMTITLLSMNDDECSQSFLPHEELHLVLGNWYDSALFFLEESQFLRVLDVRNVQTILILGTCFINFGDFNLYYHLWGCALRMGQALNLRKHQSTGFLAPESEYIRRQIWWSLVINDWLQIPLQAGHSGVDRMTAGLEFPDCMAKDLDAQPSSRPLHYLSVLAQLSSTLRQFHENISLIEEDFTSLAAATSSADQEISAIVSQLPVHLQPDDQVTSESRSRDAANPWLSWQKESLCILLLYYRLVINRPLFVGRNQGSESFKKAETVCLDASHSILSSLEEFDGGDPVSHRRLIWSFLLPAFGAAATLRTCGSGCACGSTENHKAELDKCIKWFDRASIRSSYAASAAQVLRAMF